MSADCPPIASCPFCGEPHSACFCLDPDDVDYDDGYPGLDPYDDGEDDYDDVDYYDDPDGDPHTIII